MWANAQRDGRPAEQVAPSVQRRKVWLTPTTLHAVQYRCQDAEAVESSWGTLHSRNDLSR